MRVQIKNFFTIARFGPDTIFLMSLLSIIAVFLLEFNLTLAAIVTAAAVVAIFALESFERIELQSPHERQIVGAECLVTKPISKTQRGIVKVYDATERKFGSELWSAESDCVIEEGTMARVVGMRSIILRVDPIEAYATNEYFIRS